MVRKICIVTATRADFGSLKCLIEGVETDSELELQLIVTGTHLSPEFGNTINQIIEKLPFLISSFCNNLAKLTKKTSLSFVPPALRLPSSSNSLIDPVAS